MRAVWASSANRIIACVGLYFGYLNHLIHIVISRFVRVIQRHIEIPVLAAMDYPNKSGNDTGRDGCASIRVICDQDES